MAAARLHKLPMGLVFANPDQPRKLFNQEQLEELAESIRQHGLLQPIKVRPDFATGRYMIVCGERRWRAHQVLGAETIDAVVQEMSDDQLADAAIIENMQRADISPLEEARAFQARLDTGLSVEELAKRLGLKQAWRITERTSLLRLAPELQDALARGIITNSQAFEMSQLGAANQRVLFNAIKDGRCNSYRELRAVSKALQDSERQGGLFADEKTEEQRAAERETVTRLERQIEALTKLCQSSFKDNELVALRKLNSAKYAVYQEQLELIEKSIKQIRLALRAAEIAAEVARTAA